MQMLTRLVIGPLTAIGGAFPAAGLVGLIYGFPIPFRGRMQGVEAVIPSMTSLIFYGVVWHGGFVLLAGLGIIAAAIAEDRARGNRARTILLTVVFALSASLLCAVFIAVLDFFIGPW